MSGTKYTPSHGAARIARERRRQIVEEGWDAAHDDEHDGNELIAAAMAYLVAVDDPEHADSARVEWPWDPESFKPSDPIVDLAKAGALIAAELDRRLRRVGFEPNWPPRSEYVRGNYRSDERRPIPYLELDEDQQRVRGEVLHRHRLDVLAKLQVVPFNTVVKVTIPDEVRKSEHDIAEWWLYPTDLARTLWHHPESNDTDEASPLGSILQGIACVYADDRAWAELETIPGQMLPDDPSKAGAER